MIILFQNILFLKEFLACNGCFGLFSKIKKGSGASFWYTFSAWFFHKNVLCLILYQWAKFQCHTLFLSQDIKENMLLSFYLDRWWRHKLLDFSWIKEGKMKIHKFEYLENEKSFLDEIKKKKTLFQTGDFTIFVFCCVFFSRYVQLKSSFSDENIISSEIWDKL